MKKGMYWAFLTFWVLDSLTLYLAGLLYPSYFVLRSRWMVPLASVFVAGFIWTFLVWVSPPLVGLFTKIKGRTAMFVFYFLTNFVALWLTARLAPISGFGTTKFTWLIFLALVADLLQYLVWKLGNLEKMTK